MIEEPIMDERRNRTSRVLSTRLIMWVFLLALLSVLLLPTYCHPLSGNRGTVEALTLKLSAQTVVTCRGTSITVDAELVNTSNEQVAIDPRFVWYRISFLTFRDQNGKHTGGSRTMWGDPGPYDEGKYLVLKPGESFKDSRDLSLKEKFFKPGGKYTLQLTYSQFRETSFDGARVFNGSVSSNEIEFQTVTCRVKGNRK